MRIASSLGMASIAALAAAAIACGGGKSSNGSGGASGGMGGAAGSPNGGPGGTNPGPGVGGSANGGSSSGGEGGSFTPVCPPPIMPVDVSSPAAVVGTGTPASCTESALAAALAKGGVITFDCGADPVTITVTSELKITTDTWLDGAGKVTLSGGGKTRILHVASAWDQASPHVGLQHLAFTGGYTTDVPNTKETTQGGAAIFREGGSLDVIDCQFTDNHCASTGQDVSGGAITSQGVGNTVVVGSKFSKNSGSNGGAIGNLGNGFSVIDSTFDGNAATGKDGNPGNGGNGGAVVFDGKDTKMAICGCTFTGNTAGAQGGAVFRVAYGDEPTTIEKSTFDGNSADAMAGLAGALYLENTTIAMSGSTISNNRAHYGGGLWIGHAAVAQIVNVTIANNLADQGGGVWVAGEVTGSLLNCTLANNDVTPGGYAPTVFSGATDLKLVNCIVSGGGCKDKPLGEAGANLQFPDSKSPCAPSAAIADPVLGPLQDNGGPTKTMVPGAGSPAIGKGSGCPATDQRGSMRPAACTLGAVEPP
jgi:hypothetical protein